MKRSTGVTVIAVVSLLGSLLTLAMGLLVLAITVFAPAGRAAIQFPGSPATFKALMATASLVYILPAVWGTATSVGLWMLKNWARISIIVFSVVLILMGGCTGLTMFVMPLPSPPAAASDASMMSTIRIVMGGFCLTLMGIGIWWLVFFTRRKVAEQFGQHSQTLDEASSLQAIPGASTPTVTPNPTGTGRRPISITIIAVLLLAGSVSMPLALVFRAPVPLFTALVAGWPAVFVYLGFFVAQLCIGIGLLCLKPAARIGAIAYSVFAFVNTATFNFAPGGHARRLDLIEKEQSLFPGMRLYQNQSQFQFDLSPSIRFGAIAGLLVVVVQLYFLITRRVAFEHNPTELQAGPGS
jgi:hypothetical protein